MDAEALFRAVHHRMLVLAAVDCGALLSNSSII